MKKIVLNEEQMQYFLKNYSTTPSAKIAEHLKVGTRYYYDRLGKELGLTKDMDSIRSFMHSGIYSLLTDSQKIERNRKISQKRKELCRKEKTRKLFGLEPKSKISVSIMPQQLRDRLRARRYRLRQLGYILNGHNLSNKIVYYDDNTKRNLKIEDRYSKLDFQFHPVGYEETPKKEIPFCTYTPFEGERL